jgi:trehalose 6-phosphate synthase
MLRAIRDERLLALGYCDGKGKLLYRTPTFPETLDCPSLISMEKGSDPVRLLPQGAVHVSIHPMELEGIRSGSLILVHDMSFAERRSADTRKYVIILFAVLSVVISLITVLVAHLSWRGWIEGVRAMLRGEGIVRPFSQQASSSELQPLVGDLRALLRTLDAERRFADSHQTEPIGQFFRSLVPISCIMSRW